MELRKQKGLEIAALGRLTHKGRVWAVPSRRHPSKVYQVSLRPKSPTCTCPDFESRRRKCKHIFAVEHVLSHPKNTTNKRRARKSKPAPEAGKVQRPTYRQEWPAYNRAQTHEKAHFLVLLADLCQSIEAPRQEKGRPRVPLGDIIFAATLRSYSTVSGRRFMCDLREAQIKGCLSRLPSYTAMFDYLNMAALTPCLKQLIQASSLPLTAVETEFTVDLSGFSTHTYSRWYDVKYGNDEDWRDWIKVHLICGVKTHIVTGVEVTRAYANDSPYFKPLIEQTARTGFQMSEVSADKAYLSGTNIRVSLLHGAMPFIPFKTNSTPTGGGSVWARLYHFYHFQREEFLTHYHKRSNSESTFSMIKAKFGERLRCKTERAQFNEALCKILAHNLCCVIQSMYELGIEPNFSDIESRKATP